MIAIVDYGMGNLRSVEKGFHKAGVDAQVTQRPEDIEKADAVVLPGVGAFRDCMRELTDLSMVDAVVSAIKGNKPYLGICLGLQVLFSESEEFGRCRGLDIFRGKVVRFPEGRQKVPHMGWNTVKITSRNRLLDDIDDLSYLYFVHSFYVVPDDNTLISTTTDYGVEFTSMICRENVYAVQFHPEKSQSDGLKLLSNFGKIVYDRQ